MFAVGVVFCAGAVVFYAIVREPSRYFRLERVALCYPLGMTALAMPMFLLSWAGVRPQVWMMLLLVIGGAVAAYAFRRQPARSLMVVHGDGRPRLPLSEFEWLLIGIIALCFGARTFASLLAPLNDWDGICIWALKAKILYYNTVGTTDYFQSESMSPSNATYPLLWPMMYAWICRVLGQWDDLGMLVLNPINMIVFAALLYCALKRFTTRTVALGITAMMVSLPTLLHYTECGQADVPLMMISGASLFCLFRWMRNEDRSAIWLAAVLMGGALFTKEEGRILMGAHVSAGALFILLDRKAGGWKRLAGQLGAYSLIALAIAAPWFLFRRTITVGMWHMEGSGLHTIRWGEIPSLLSVIAQNAFNFHNQVNLPKWIILWPLFVGGTILTFRRVILAPWICLLTAFMLHGIVLGLLVLSSHDPITMQQFEIAFERYTLIMMPPVWLLLGFQINHFYEVWRAERAS